MVKSMKSNPGPAMNDKEEGPSLTSSDNSDSDSDNSRSSDDFPSPGSGSEKGRGAPWSAMIERKEDSDTDSEVLPTPLEAAQAKTPKVEKKIKSDQNAEELRNEGNDLFKKSDYAEAIVKYQEAVDVNPEDTNNAAKCYSNIAHCYNKKKDFRKGISNSMKAMAAQPSFVRGYSRCATAYFHMGREFMAALVYLKGLAIIPASTELSDALRQLRQSHGVKVEQAEEHVKVNCKGNAAGLDIALENDDKYIHKDDVLAFLDKNMKEFGDRILELVDGKLREYNDIVEWKLSNMTGFVTKSNLADFEKTIQLTVARTVRESVSEAGINLNRHFDLLSEVSIDYPSGEKVPCDWCEDGEKGHNCEVRMEDDFGLCVLCEEDSHPTLKCVNSKNMACATCEVAGHDDALHGRVEKGGVLATKALDVVALLQDKGWEVRIVKGKLVISV